MAKYIWLCNFRDNDYTDTTLHTTEASAWQYAAALILERLDEAGDAYNLADRMIVCHQIIGGEYKEAAKQTGKFASITFVVSKRAVIKRTSVKKRAKELRHRLLDDSNE